MADTHYDVLIVGGGPAGLSAALCLGRACRRVAVFDDRRPRNAAAVTSHGFLSRDGSSVAEILDAARDQLQAYPSVESFAERIVDGRIGPGAVELRTETGRSFLARKVILASGLTDELPPVPGLRECWGRSVFSCPYCHAYEFRDRPLGVLANGPAAFAAAALMLAWSSDLVLLT